MINPDIFISKTVWLGCSYGVTINKGSILYMWKKAIHQCIRAETTLSATYLPVMKNTRGDFESRKQKVHIKLGFNEFVFHFMCRELGFFHSIDLLITRFNT